MTASLCDYLFTNHENGTKAKENVTQNKEILPLKVENILLYVAFKGFRIRFIENRMPGNDKKLIFAAKSI